MKKLLSLILSFVLLVSPFSSVMAQSQPGVDDVFTQTGTQGSGKGFYRLQAENLGAAAAGLNMYVCYSTGGFSHTLFAIGGSIYIAGEIRVAKDAKAYREYRKNRLKALEQDTRTAGGAISQATADIQTKALQEKLTEERMNLDLLERRKEFADKAAFFYDLAAIGAGYEVLTHFSAPPWSLWYGYTYCPMLPIVVPTIIGTLIAAFSTYENVTNAMDATGEDKLGINSLAFAAMLQTISAGTAIAFSFGVIAPVSRLGVFLAQVGFAEAVRDGLEDKIRDAKNNIAKLEGMLSKWQMQNQPSGGILPGLASGGSSSGDSGFGGLPGSGEIHNLPNVHSPQASNVGCFSNSGNGVNLSQAGCSNPIKFDTKLPDFKNPELTSLTQQALAYGNSIASGDAKAASIQGPALFANAGRVRELRNDSLSRAMAEAKKNGIDMNQIIKDKENEMNKVMNGGVAATNIGAGLASTNGSNGSSDSNLKTTAVNSGNSSDLGSIKDSGKTSGFKMPSIGPAVTNSNSASDGTGMSDEEKDVIAANIDRNKSEFKSNEGDSLFRVVSKTYIRNLDRILTRKKKNLDEETVKEEQ